MTDDSFWTPGPAEPSPDGLRIAYVQRDREGVLRLWLAPVSGAPPRQMDTGVRLWDEAVDAYEDECGPQWSPDGERLAIVGQHPSDGRSAIWLVGIDERRDDLLVDHPAADRAPRWSPDGARVAFVSRRDGRDAICVVGTDGGGPALQLTNGWHDDRDPDWSTDGTQLAFRRSTLADPLRGAICVVAASGGKVRQLTEDADADRRSPRWSPTRPLIVYVSDEGDWANVAVVNADNGAGWLLADEAGDKADPRWAPGGDRIVYTRARGLYVECCERGMNAAAASAFDPRHGVARAPGWLADGRVLYAFATPRQPFASIVQEPRTATDRVYLPRAVDRGMPDRRLPVPQALPFAAGDETLDGLLYRPAATTAAPAPGLIFFDGPPSAARRGKLQTAEPLLAAAGFAVFAPNLHGVPGFGRTVTRALLDDAESEIEVADVVDAASALRAQSGVDPDRIALVGRGYGGLLALLAIGARPGAFAAAVAIDPITDWDHEFDAASGAWRRWLIAHFGAPLVRRAPYAVRQPATFAALIDVPLLLIATETAPPSRHAQLDAFAARLTDLGVAFERETADRTPNDDLRRAAAFMRRVLPSNNGRE